MSFQTMNEKIEKHILPIANKLSSQRHLRAIRDAFISLLPITLMGGVTAVISAAPVTEETTNGFLLAWASFVQQNSMLLNWISALTLGGMSIYVCIAIIYYLTRHFKHDFLVPAMLSVCGFLMLVMTPQQLGWDGKVVEISYMDGKGILPAILISILTVEAYHFMRSHDWGRINLPPSVPASLSETFASLVPGFEIISGYVAIFAIFHAFDTTFPEFIYTSMAPSLQAADSLLFIVIMTLLVHFFWFFGIHDAALSGILAPIRDGNLSINVAAKAAGEALPHVFTTPFWVYFVAIGGCGSLLALAILLVRSKSKQLKTVGRIGIIPAFFGIGEPIVFGVPVMLNPYYLIPFLCASTFNAIVSFVLMESNIIGRTFAMLSWQMPNIPGAFLSTMDIKAMFLVCGLLVVDILIYYPFFKMHEKQCVAMELETEDEEE